MAFVLPPLKGLPLPLNAGAKREIKPLTWSSNKAVPNFSAWQTGDVVLVASDGSTLGQVIEGVQNSIVSGQPPMGDPAWTHVALYVDQGLLIESVPRIGVRYCPVHEYAQDRAIRVRRLVRAGAVLTPHEGRAVVNHASHYFEQRYSYWGIARHLFMQMALPRADQFFCSAFIAVVYAQALKVSLDQYASHRPLLPATLVNHGAFADLDVEWCVPR